MKNVSFSIPDGSVLSTSDCEIILMDDDRTLICKDEKFEESEFNFIIIKTSNEVKGDKLKIK